MRKTLFLLGLSLAGCFPKLPKDAAITRFVYDDGDLFTPAEEATLDSLLRAYEQRTTNEFVVYTEADSTIADSTFQQMVEQLSDTLGVGKRYKNNGLVTAFNKGGGLLFTLNAIGYVTAAVAMVIPLALAVRFRWVVRLGLMGYAATTILGWAIQGPYYETAYIAKAIEVALIVLVAVDFARMDGNPVAVVKRELAAFSALVTGRGTAAAKA